MSEERPLEERGILWLVAEVREQRAAAEQWAAGCKTLQAEVERLRAENAGASYALAALRVENAQLRGEAECLATTGRLLKRLRAAAILRKRAAP